jgi:hypothetical protein
VSIHSTEQDALLFVLAAAESRVQNVRVRPEFKWNSENLQNLAAHPLPRFFRFFGKRREVIELVQLFAAIGGDQTHATHHGVAVGIDESRKERFAAQIHALRACTGGLCHLGEISDRQDFLPTHGDGFRIRVVWLGCEYLGVIKDGRFWSVALREQRD